MKCFIDMDGIIADFVTAISTAHNRLSPYTDPSLYGVAVGLWDMEKIWGITAREFWVPSNSHAFWNTIAKTTDGDSIVRLAEDKFGSENCAILTAPSQAEGCVSGKRAWIGEYYPQFKARVIFATAKEFLAGPDRVLIDDRDRNIDVFTEAGGQGILVPRLWNRRWQEADNALVEVKKGLDATIDHRELYKQLSSE